MSTPRTHSITTTDGVTIGATVHGHGPPLVSVQGGIGDGDLDWDRLVAHLSGRFTCHLPSMRGRGLSGDHPDLSLSRQVADLVAYLDSLSEPVGLVGWSLGAAVALVTAARSEAVNAVAAFEPAVMSVMDEQEQGVMGGAVARTGELAAQGRLTDAARAFARWPFTDDDMAMAEDAGYFQATGRYVPNVLNTLEQLQEYAGPTVDDPAVLDAISVPVLMLHGSNTKPWLIAGAQHVAHHVPKARIQQIPDAGHAAPLTHPEALGDALTAFFQPAQQPA